MIEFINDADYNIVKSVKTGDKKWTIVWRCPIYRKWESLKEKTTECFLKSHPTYIGVTIHEDWYTFSKFRNWVLSLSIPIEHLHSLHLDKDIKFGGATKHYSPEHCLFIPLYINECIHLNTKQRGEYMMGVNMRTDCKPSAKLFRSKISYFKKLKSLGSYYSEFEAHRAWQRAKINYFNDVILKYKSEPFYQNDVEDALIAIRNKVQSDYDNNLETTNYHIR